MTEYQRHLRDLKHRDWRRRVEAIEGLAALADRRCVLPFSAALDDWNGTVRQRAVAGLKAIGEPALAALCEALTSEHSGTGRSAARALIEVGAPIVERAIAGAETEAGLRALASLALLRGSAVPHLCQALQVSDVRVRAYAAVLLGWIADPSAASHLCAALRDDAEVVRRAAEALTVIGAPAVEPLVRFLVGESDEVQKRVADVLGMIAARNPCPALREALPELHRLQAAWSFEPEWLKLAYRTAIAQIEAATPDMRDLPLPSSAPLPRAENLPLPDAPPAPETCPEEGTTGGPQI